MNVTQAFNVRTKKIFHFAPALVYNLPELCDFACAHVSTDHLRLIANKCPHPQMSAFVQQSGTISPLRHLYHITQYVDMAERDISKGYNSIPQFIQPLVTPVTCQLLRHYLSYDLHLTPPHPIQSDVDKDSSGLEPSLPYSPTIFCDSTSLELIPDDALRRLSTYANISDSHGKVTLKHSYAIVRSDILTDNLSTFSTNGDNEISGPDSSNQIHFYIIQFRETNVYDSNLSSGLQLNGGNYNPDMMNTMLQYLLHGAKQQSESGHSSSRMLRNDNSIESSLANQGHPASTLKSNIWDTNLFSTLCKWRSCSAESCSESGTKYLCRYHLELKIFLDNTPQSNENITKGIGTKESHKYLPKKVSAALLAALATNPAKDIDAIKSISSLIQELWDGKLKSTLLSFSMKTGQDCSLKRRMETINQNLAIASSQEKSLQALDAPVKTNLRQTHSSSHLPKLDVDSSKLRPSWSQWRSEEDYLRYIYIYICMYR